MSFATIRTTATFIVMLATSNAWAQTTAAPAVSTVPGMPPVADAANLYSETTAAKLSPAVAGDLPRVYVPHVQSNDVYVIDPATFTVISKFKVGLNPQHVGPKIGQDLCAIGTEHYTGQVDHLDPGQHRVAHPL